MVFLFDPAILKTRKRGQANRFNIEVHGSAILFSRHRAKALSFCTPHQPRLPDRRPGRPPKANSLAPVARRIVKMGLKHLGLKPADLPKLPKGAVVSKDAVDLIKWECPDIVTEHAWFSVIDENGAGRSLSDGLKAAQSLE